MTTSSEEPQDAVPPFPTMEGGAVPAEQFFEGTVWHYLIVLDLTQVPVLLRESLRFYIIRSAIEIVGSGHFSLWENQESMSIAVHTVPGKMEMFSQRSREAAQIFATHHLVRINEYTMSQRGNS
jgi:hypothetical protein